MSFVAPDAGGEAMKHPQITPIYAEKDFARSSERQLAPSE
jgi:hypothetical protein